MGRLFPAHDDWYEWVDEPPLASPILVRVVATSRGRLVLAGLRIDGEPTAGLLRAIPVGRIEAAANAQLTIADDEVRPIANGDALGRRRGAPPSEPSDIDGWETPGPDEVTVRRRAGQGRPDHFYREIATAYLDLAQESPRPAADLAGSRGVPTTTAHRWIKEARRRGFLPPGRPGKAG